MADANTTTRRPVDTATFEPDSHRFIVGREAPEYNFALATSIEAPGQQVLFLRGEVIARRGYYTRPTLVGAQRLANWLGKQGGEGYVVIDQATGEVVHRAKGTVAA